MKILFILIAGLVLGSLSIVKAQNSSKKENLIVLLEKVWQTEQTPIRLRDSLMRIYGVDSKQYHKYQRIYKENHKVNEEIVKNILDTYGWPTKKIIGDRGNWTICNVLQHSELAVRLKYIPLMKQAVKDKKLEARFLVRAEDRNATESGDLQIYGGQMKYYPETKTFNVWPVFDPINIDKRRAEIGLEPIALFLKRRFNFEWNLQEQIKRTENFIKKKRMINEN